MVAKILPVLRHNCSCTSNCLYGYCAFVFTRVEVVELRIFESQKELNDLSGQGGGHLHSYWGGI